MKIKPTKDPVQVRAYEKAKRLLGGRSGCGDYPEDRYILRILETRANQAAGRQAKKEKRAKAPGAKAKADFKKLVKKLDDAFSLFVRTRDTRECDDGVRRGHCVTCGSYHTLAEFDCGHWIPRRKGGKLTTRWHESNAHAQCTHCNRWKGGATEKHEEAIRRLHGATTPSRLQAIHKFGFEPTVESMQKMLEGFKARTALLKGGTPPSLPPTHQPQPE